MVTVPKEDNPKLFVGYLVEVDKMHTFFNKLSFHKN